MKQLTGFYILTRSSHFKNRVKQFMIGFWKRKLMYVLQLYPSPIITAKGAWISWNIITMISIQNNCEMRIWMFNLLDKDTRLYKNSQFFFHFSYDALFCVFTNLYFTSREFPEPPEQSGWFSFGDKNPVIIPYYDWWIFTMDGYILWSFGIISM